jgi:molybdate-binding protein
MSSAGTFQETDSSAGTHESNALFNRAIEMLNRNRASAARKHLEEALRSSAEPGISFHADCASRSTPRISIQRGAFARRPSR